MIFHEIFRTACIGTSKCATRFLCFAEMPELGGAIPGNIAYAT